MAMLAEVEFQAFLGASDDLIRNIDGDEVGYLVAKVAEIKRVR